MQALCTDIPLKHLPLLRLVVGLPVNQDVVYATLAVAEAQAAGFTPRLKAKGADEDKGKHHGKAKLI